MINFFKIFKADIAYLYAKMKAEKQHISTGKQQFLLMSDNGRLMIMDDTHFYGLRKCGSMPRNITPRMLKRIAVYYTDGLFKGRYANRMSDKTRHNRKQRYMGFIKNIK